jgi:hypothetical protein
MKITHTVHISDVNMDANDWGFYADTPFREDFALSLNATLEKAVNTYGSTFESTRSAMDAWKDELKYIGAFNEDILFTLNLLLKKLYMFAG